MVGASNVVERVEAARAAASPYQELLAKFACINEGCTGIVELSGDCR